MPKISNVRKWVRGLFQAAVSGAAGAAALVIVDPHTFTEWEKLVKVGMAAAVIGIVNYLVRSPLPLPAEDDTE